MKLSIWISSALMLLPFSASAIDLGASMTGQLRVKFSDVEAGAWYADYVEDSMNVSFMSMTLLGVKEKMV